MCERAKPAAIAPRKMTSVTGRHQSAGFTLLEVLLATLILAFAVSALMAALGNGVQLAASSGNYSQAMLLAESQISGVGVDVPVKESSDSGDSADGGLHWSRVIEMASDDVPIGPAEADMTVGVPGAPAGTVVATPADPHPSGVDLYRVTVTVSWKGAQGDRSFKLVTYRLGPKVKLA